MPLELERTHPGAAGILHDAMALRWCAAGMIQARGQFRRLNGHLYLPALRAALVPARGRCSPRPAAGKRDSHYLSLQG
ncbi:MAG: hypothetical protein H0W37_03930 [Pseudonocardiales bacterium]|nr:hypothetical protein [Pseudonocardiales bacterium]